MRRTVLAVALATGVALSATSTLAQTIKVGVINTYSGPQASLGDQIDKGIQLYLKKNEGSLPAGVKIELVRRDDTGPNPEVAIRLAQELIVREKVQFITGVVWTPVAAALAKVVDQAKVPLVLANASAAMLPTLSPWVTRMSLSMWHAGYPLGQWAARNGLGRVYTAVSDYTPGHDSEQAFTKGYVDNGGVIAGSVRMPLQNPDFVPFLQRIKDAKPDAVFAFLPAGRQATAFMKAFGDLGLSSAGIKLIGTGDIVTDEELPNMGQTPLGVITAFHYSAAADRPENKEFVAAWKQEFGPTSTPNYMSVGGWDAMGAIVEAIKAQNGKVTAEKSLELLRNWKNAASPRGPVSIDPSTGDIVQNVYIRRTEMRDGALANIEFETFPQVKDPWKELNKKK
ncbi:ABC transporter substrate-binding protein [Enterovirga sp.]|jgi:branched-chain amino acid transport system substrate-binding protein|uniref:ABC transporter substrate-binding protein n=1 Tax=Enterovirga sp. TaxID=2026350 RepID=UPI00261860CC|nr:ABC transporter substrate-binding protein [Enterovirga sp.]MDB5592890.1 transporter substrate-binding protein [Enterovirga sp.]